MFLNLKVTTVICHSFWDVQPRRCCWFLLKLSHQSPLNWRWLSSHDVHVRQSCNLVCKRVGNWPVEQGKTNFTDCLQIVYSWHSWWNSPDVKLLSTESYIFSRLHLFCPKTGTFSISILPAGNIFRTFGFTMSAWHHIFSGSCAFGSLPKPRGRLEAHGSAFLCYGFAVFEDKKYLNLTYWYISWHLEIQVFVWT